MSKTGLFSKLEEALISEGLITEDQLSIAMESRKILGCSIEQVLIDKGFVKEDILLKALAGKMNTSFVSLSSYRLDPEVVKLLPVNIARRCRAIPLFKIENKVTIATSNPLNLAAMDDVRHALNADTDPILALDGDIERAIGEYYRGKGLTAGRTDVAVEIIGTDEADGAISLPLVKKLEIEASGEKIVSTVSNIVVQAFQDRASDIHIEPGRESVGVRLRIDGILEELVQLPKNMHLPVLSRIKIMGGMDVAERRVPQDGRVRVKVAGREIDMRIATYPTMFGEAAAIRLLSKEQLMTLKDLGFAGGDMETFEKLIRHPHGILLVTGPTGSGKTTTLYAALMQINSKDKHILSIEDPIENEIEGVDQEQVNVKSGMTFATSLRAMLRQDPDVIMVGEIRDFETADIALRAAMTGHLVFSTLHTNSAVGAIARLVDIGVEAYMVSSTVIGVMAQRLVRKICERCRVEIEPDPNEVRKFGRKVQFAKVFKGGGCKYCRSTGYSGRIGLFEIVTMTDELKKMIDGKKSEAEIKDMLAANGHRALLDDGMAKIQSGVTTIEEVLKVAPDS